MGQNSNSDFKPIPLSVPTIGGNEWTYIKECLDTNWLSYVGPFVSRFERDLALRTGSRFAVAMNSGTSALHIALLTAGVEPDSEVVMPAITFVAPANAVAYCRAWPVLVDIDPHDWQMDVGKVSDFLNKDCITRDGKLWNRMTGRRISAILPVHLLGDMADVDAIADLAQQFGLPVIEDAAECLGATYKARPIGALSPKIDSEMRQVITSFNGNKIVTTGGGGAVLTDSERMANRGRHLSTTAKSDPVKFQHDEIGYNYRLNNICAALGTAQLERLDEFVAIKRGTAIKYERVLQGSGCARLHPESVSGRSIFWLYTVMTSEPSFPIVERLNGLGIQARPVWTPLYDLPMFHDRAYLSACDFAPKFHEHAMSLPSSVGITDGEIGIVAEALRDSVDRISPSTLTA
ncbi:MAG TPA: aminotransferase class I/II-fold pyridoxal phosphate-dependent enzyme [Bryobacteraceae bacterium]|nr:aminotransferase class I/II-fold pyridoxal phosphate-dependent enzyme [Bryobacteraceae bacterium]